MEKSSIDPIERDRLDNERIKCLIAFTLGENDSCIDVGANEGTVLTEIVRCAPRGHHIAYEPIPQLHRRLVEAFPGVDVRCAALSDAAGASPFTYVTTNTGYSGIRRRTYPGPVEIEMLDVRLERLDDLPREFAPALIKIDVEGGERGVIEGGIEMIRRHQPIVIFEHGRGAAEHYGTRPEQMFDLLCGTAGLRIFDLDGNGPYGLGHFVAAFDSGARWNFMARQ